MKRLILIFSSMPLLAEPDMVFVRALEPVTSALSGYALQVFAIGLTWHVAMAFYFRTQGDAGPDKSRSHMWSAILGLPIYLIIFVPTTRSSIQTVDYEDIHVPLGTYVIERLMAISDGISARVITAGSQDIDELGDLETTQALGMFLRNRVVWTSMIGEALATRRTTYGLSDESDEGEIEYDEDGRPWWRNPWVAVGLGGPLGLAMTGVAGAADIATDGISSAMDGVFRFAGLAINSPLTVVVWAATAIVGVVVSGLHGMLRYLPAFAWAVFLVLAPFVYLLRGKGGFGTIIHFFLGVSLIKPAMYIVVMLGFLLIETTMADSWAAALGSLSDSFYGQSTQIQVASYINDNGSIPGLDLIPILGIFLGMLLSLIVAPVMTFKFLTAQGGELASGFAAAATMLMVQTRSFLTRGVKSAVAPATAPIAAASKVVPPALGGNS